MSDSTADRDPIEMLADSFLARFRAGERPSVEEYAAKHPELADQIRELLPALVMLEQDMSAVDGERHQRRPRFRGRQARPRSSSATTDPPRDRPGRHGRGLRGGAAVPGPARRPEGSAVAARGGAAAGAFPARGRTRRGCTTRTSCRSSTSASATGVHYYAMQFIQGQSLDVVIDALIAGPSHRRAGRRGRWRDSGYSRRRMIRQGEKITFTNSCVAV